MMADVDAQTTETTSNAVESQIGGFNSIITAAKGIIGVKEYPNSAMWIIREEWWKTLVTKWFITAATDQMRNIHTTSLCLPSQSNKQ
jgi:hypothetical protein